MKKTENSRILVHKTLAFDKPQRVPRHLWTLPWAQMNYAGELERIQTDFPDDITWSPPSLKRLPRTSGNQYAEGIYIDEWGCTFENRQAGIVGEVKKPLISSWGELERVRVPSEMLDIDIEAVNAFCEGENKFVLAGAVCRPFERLQFLRGTANVFFDLIDRPAEFSTLIKLLHDLFVEQWQIWAQTSVDGLFIADDWGSQKSLLISPDQWRSIFKPLYKDYIDIAHQHGKIVFMHSDGYIKEIIPDLIEIGLDALNSQIFCMGVHDLGQLFKGKLTFWGEIDRQHLLCSGTQDEIVQAIELVKDYLYAEGGVIAQCEFGPGAKPQNVYKVFETWSKLPMTERVVLNRKNGNKWRSK